MTDKFNKKKTVVTPFQRVMRWIGWCGIGLMLWIGPFSTTWGAGSGLVWSGRVVRVVDGDTLRVERNGREVKIRLEGIDAPERDQPWGSEATAFARQQALGKRVTVRDKERDQYGRMVATIILPDGSSLNERLVRQGLAWWYRAYSTDRTLQAVQAMARRERLGLWSDSHPEPPWIWRRRHR